MWFEDSEMTADEAASFTLYVKRLAEHCDDLALEVTELERGGVPGPMTGYLCRARAALNLAGSAMDEFVAFRLRQAEAGS